MLVFRRFTSATSTTQKRELQEFFSYHITRADLKPWIYRPKNANILLTMDLKDPNTNAPLKPRSPVPPLSKKVLDQYINSIKPNSRELVDWLRGWTNVSTRKRDLWQYLSSSHLQNMLMQSFFRIGSYASIVNTLYSRQKKFVQASNRKAFDIEHFFNTVVTCNLHRNRELGYKTGVIALRKLEVAWRQVSHRDNETGLAQSLIKALFIQQGITQPIQTSILKDLSVKPIELPSLPKDAGPGVTAASLNEQKWTYVIARTVLDFDAKAEQPIKTFVQSYQTLAKGLGREDVYQKNIELLKQNLAAKRARAEVHKKESNEKPPETKV